MKNQIKFIVIVLLMTLLAFCLIGCTKNTVVTFKQADDTIVATVIADKEGKTYAPSVTVAEGYVIDGWYTTADYSGVPVDIAQTAFTQDATLYAKVSAVDYTLNYNLGYEDATDTPPQVTFNSDGTFITAATPEREGYIFTGWISDDNLYEAGQTVTVNFIGDRTLVATWETKMLTVNFYDDVGLLTTKENVPYGSDVIAPLAPHTYSWCYEFNEWDKSLANVKSDMDVHAQYTYLPTELENGNQYTFTEVEEEKEVIGYKLKIPGTYFGSFYMPDFQVPETLALPIEHNGKPVIALDEDEYAFVAQNMLARLYVPGCYKTITSIQSCSSLNEVIFDEGVQTLSKYALWDCRALSKIYIPASLTTIEHYAFVEVGLNTQSKMPDFECASGGNFVFENSTFKSADGKKIILTDKYVTHFYADEKVEELYPNLFLTPHSDSPLQSVIIDGNLTTLYAQTFYGCRQLTTVSFNGTLEEIEGYDGYFELYPFHDDLIWTITQQSAFGDCTSLTSVNLPYGIKRIGNGVFFDAFYIGGGWSEIVLPDTLEYLAWDAFANKSNDNGITSIKMVDENGQQVSGNDYYLVENNCIIAKNVDIKISDTQTIKGDSLYIYAGKSPATSYTVPFSVKEIKEFAFAKTRYLENLTLPEGIKEIKAGCIGGNLYINGESVGSSIVTLNIPDSVEIIRSKTLCYGGSGWDGYGGVTALPNLTTLTIGANSHLTTLEHQAMSGLGVTTFFVPASVMSIGVFSITGPNLTTINVDPDNEHYASFEGVLFDYDITQLLLYPWAKSGLNYTVPATVTTLKDRCFCGNKYLEHLTLPESLTAIESGMLANAKSIQTLTFESNTAPQFLRVGMYEPFEYYNWDTNEFETLNITVYVPIGAYYSYLNSFMDYSYDYISLIST